MNSELCLQNPYNENHISYLAWEEGNATAKDCAADSLGILWILVSAVKATPVKIKKKTHTENLLVAMFVFIHMHLK